MANYQPNFPYLNPPRPRPQDPWPALTVQPFPRPSAKAPLGILGKNMLGRFVLGKSPEVTPGLDEREIV